IFCMKNHTNSSTIRRLARMLYEKSYKSSSAWMISMMLFEKSHKFIRLPAYQRRNLQRRRNGARRAPVMIAAGKKQRLP
ncbi:hypothetical protein, partial [Cohnella xylanilytica]|uniref:hypothetical protein n=1 Tax=Cohnella xylanilytica TaxID=557555 RepID=UPI001C87E37B